MLGYGLFTGSWRGDSWGLEADAAPARLHYICGGAARVPEVERLVPAGGGRPRIRIV